MPNTHTSSELPTISIVINNYNYAQFLADCIQSALEQTSKPLEIIVVDDGSSDNSAEILQQYQDDTIQIRQKNQGQAAAINAGFEASSGTLILFLDADDRLLPNAITEITRIWTSGSSKLQYPLELINGDGQVTGLMPKAGQALPEGDLLPELLNNGTYRWMPTSGNVFSKAILDKIMPIPSEQFRISADQYLSIRCLRHGPIQSCSIPLAQYRLHGGNAFSSNRIIAPDEKSFSSRITSHTNRHQIMADEAAWSDFELPTNTKSYYTTFYAWIDVALSLRLFGEESIKPYRGEEISKGVCERIERNYPKFSQKWRALMVRSVFYYLLHCPLVLLKPSLALGRKVEPWLFGCLQKWLSY